MVTIIQGDCREKLKTLKTGSMHCCVTSPPYFGLRDYGTATWEGGDMECDHKAPPTGGKIKGSMLGGTGNRGGFSSDGQYRSICHKCGARRIDNQIGLESSLEAYVQKLVEVFREVRRVLRDDGTVWLNLGDSYASNGGEREYGSYDGGTGLGPGTKRIVNAGLKPKNMCGIPWRVALALQADGWYLRSDIIWHKLNPMPASVKDRVTPAHEYIFLLSKSEKYFYDSEAIKEKAAMDSGFAKSRINGRDQKFTRDDSRRDASSLPEYIDNGYRNKRSVWTISTNPYHGAHFATFPAELISPCIQAGTSEYGCCPKCGAPWKRVMAKTDIVDENAKGSRFDKGKTAVNGAGRTQEGERFVNKQVGWRPTCDCIKEKYPYDAEKTGEQWLDLIESTAKEFSPIPCTVLDPFAGSGTTGQVCEKLGRNSILIELNPDYIKLINQRTGQKGLFVTT